MKQKIEFPLFSGSKGRLSLPISKLLYNGTIFVEREEAEDYKANHPDQNYVILEDSNRGFGYLCNRMLKFADANDKPYYLFCDDDVLGFKRRDKVPVNLNDFFREGVQLMEDNGYSQLMMSFQGHNWYYEDSIKEKIGAWCVVINKTKDLKKVGGYDERLPIFNDWDMSANLIRSGYKTACWYDYMFNHKMKSQKGGASDIYKKQEKIDLAINMLKIKYGAKTIRTVQAHGQREARFRWSQL